MNYYSVQEIAKKWDVTPRAVQKWAKAGKIPYAKKMGHAWLIPEDATKPGTQSDTSKSGEKIMLRLPLPLLRGAYEIGKCKEYLDSIVDPDDKKIATAEYYYYTGQAEKAAELAEEYLDSPDASLRYSAGVICTFANLFRGHIHLASFVSDLVAKRLEESLQERSSKELEAILILTADMGKYLLQISVPTTPPLEENLRYLPGGIRLFACYLLMQKAYLNKNFERSLGIGDIALSISGEFYPVAVIQIHLLSVACLLNLKRTKEATERFLTAWEIAKKDGLITFFSTNPELHGLAERVLKRDFREEYKKILVMTNSFRHSWQRLHKPSEEDLSHTLTIAEFSIARLVCRGWTAKEIADYTDRSERTVQNHIANIYEKLGISGKKELNRFMLT